MICIFDKLTTDFSGNGIGPLCPTSCEVSETLNGEYELKMEHPLDEFGKWTRIEYGRILRVPVPSAMTPQVNLITQSTTEIYKTNANSRPIRAKASSSGKVLAKYKKNKQVVLIEKTSSTWYKVVGPDGKQGYMQKSHLTYVKTKYSLPEATGEVVKPSQQRDQPFRIYRVVPELDKITVHARHIFYDLLDNMIKSYKPNKAVIGSVVVSGISSSCLSEHDFTFYSNIERAADEEALEDDVNTVDFININPVDALIGDNGVCHFYGGELARDWFDVYVINRVGLDSGVQIREGKNLLGINYDVDDTDVITRIMPTGEDKDGNLLYLPETYIDSEHADEYLNPKWYHLVVDDCKENPKATKDNPKKTKTQCYKQMRAAAQKEFDNGCDLPTVTLNVDFINCAETEEYRQYSFLQNIYLGDSVRVITKRLGVSVTLRMTEYTFDCLTRKYTKMTLGTVADGLEANTISPRQIPAGSITGSKLAINSVGIGQLQDGSVGSLQIQDAAIGNTHIQHAAIEQAHIAEAAITYAHIAQACVEALISGSLEAVTAKIQELDAGDIQTDTLAAALATFVVLTAGTATFDAATIQHLVVNALNLEFGVGDEVFINNLKVAYAQVVSAAIGNLCIKASDGNYYAIDVGEDGCVTATISTVSGEEIASGQTDGGRVILETDITAQNLNTGNLLSTYALVNKIDASRIDVDTLLARKAFIDALYTSRIYGGESLQMIIGNQSNAIQSAQSAANAAQADIDGLQIGGRNLYLGTKNFDGSNWIQWSFISWTRADADYDGFAVMERQSAWNGLSQRISAVIGDTFVLSAYIKRESAATVIFYCEGSNRNGTNLTASTGTGWKRIEIAFQVTTTQTIEPRFENSVEGRKISICGMKLERGTRASDWTPAPEDTEEAITSVDAKVDGLEDTVFDTQEAASEALNRIMETESSLGKWFVFDSDEGLIIRCIDDEGTVVSAWRTVTSETGYRIENASYGALFEAYKDRVRMTNLEFKKNNLSIVMKPDGRGGVVWVRG